MKYFARTDKDGVVIETFNHATITPDQCHVPEIAEQFVECPAEVQSGYRLHDGHWTAPQPAAVQGVPPKVTPPQFYMLFTMEEQLELEEQRQKDAVIALFFKRLDDPRLTEVDLSIPSVQAAIKYVLSKVHVGQINDRFNEIMTGVWG